MASRVTGAERVELAKAVGVEYQGGRSIREIAAEHERSYGFVHRLLIEAGAVFRSRGGRRRGGSS